MDSVGGLAEQLVGAVELPAAQGLERLGLELLDGRDLLLAGGLSGVWTSDPPRQREPRGQARDQRPMANTTHGFHPCSGNGYETTAAMGRRRDGGSILPAGHYTQSPDGRETKTPTVVDVAPGRMFQPSQPRPVEQRRLPL